MDIRPLTPVERATAVLLTQAVRLLNGDDKRDIYKILNRYGMQPEEAMLACEWLLVWATCRAEIVMKHDGEPDESAQTAARLATEA